MAFVLTHIVECDHRYKNKKDGQKCTLDEQVQARSREEANSFFRELGWKVVLTDNGYAHYCPEHSGGKP